MRRASTSDVEAEEDVPGAGGVGRAGVEDVATLAVDKLATETLGGGFGGKGMFATHVTTTSSSRWLGFIPLDASNKDINLVMQGT